MGSLAAPVVLVLADGHAGKVVDTLRRRLGSPPPDRVRRQRTYFDTFDGRLFRRGLVLEHDRPAPPLDADTGAGVVGGGSEPEESWVRLRGVGAHDTKARAPLAELAPHVDDLGDTSLRDLLRPVVHGRALLPVAATVSTETTMRILGPEDKTTARVVLSEGVAVHLPSLGTRPLEPTVSVIPVRGYEAAVAQAVDALAAFPTRRGVDPFVRAARAVGASPGVDPSEWRVPLDPDAPAAGAVMALMERLSRVMTVNEAGMLADVDIEFLHDYRVAVRRARTIIRAARKVIDPDLARSLGEELRWLGQVTTPVRDLDVLLVDLPTDPDLGPLRSLLEADRAEARSALVDAVGSARYRALHDRIGGLVRPQAPPPAEPSVAQWAARRIARAHRSVLDAGREASEPEQLHDVRKKAKRLRYLIDACASLYDEEDVASAIKELKAFQDVLGTFQDGEVHAEILEGAANRLEAAPEPTRRAVAALVERERRQQEEARAAFAARFEAFASNRRRFGARWRKPRKGHRS